MTILNAKSLCLLILLAAFTTAEISLWMDTFQRDLCRERWLRMDWQMILRPCKNNLKFGENRLDESLRSSTKWSHVLKTDIKKTGQFSRIFIQSRNNKGIIKKIGGDSWRIFIRGPSFIAPFVEDLNNGVYQATFMIMEPGLYRAEIMLESSLCEGFKNPPKNWKPAEGDVLNTTKSENVWKKLRGGVVSFKMEPSDETHLREVRNSINRWKQACGKQFKCDLLWTGFGRWVNQSWIPLVDDSTRNEDLDDASTSKCHRKKTAGELWIQGDCLTKDLFESWRNTSICTKTFKKCHMQEHCQNVSRADENDEDVDSTSNPSEHRLLKSLRKAIKRYNSSSSNALLLNYGHDQVASMAFDDYKRLINKAAGYMPLFQGHAIWRTTTSLWKPTTNAKLHFRSYQRTTLFNAYATSAMCAAGLPTLELFQMSTSYPQQPHEGGHFNKTFFTAASDIITDYFKQKAEEGCSKHNKTKKEKHFVEANNTMFGNDTDDIEKSLMEINALEMNGEGANMADESNDTSDVAQYMVQESTPASYNTTNEYETAGISNPNEQQWQTAKVPEQEIAKKNISQEEATSAPAQSLPQSNESVINTQQSVPLAEGSVRFDVANRNDETVRGYMTVTSKVENASQNLLTNSITSEKAAGGMKKTENEGVTRSETRPLDGYHGNKTISGIAPIATNTVPRNSTAERTQS